MNKLYLSALLLFLSISPVLAENWIRIPNTNIDYDKDSTQSENNNIYSVQTKSPTKDGFEIVDTNVINSITKQFNMRGAKLYDTVKQKYVYQQKYL